MLFRGEEKVHQEAAVIVLWSSQNLGLKNVDMGDHST